MGYTHYWKPTRQVTDEEFKSFVDACKKLYQNLPAKTNTAGGYHEDDPLEIAGWDGSGHPEFTSIEVAFNGFGELSHETFLIEKDNPTRRVNYCKTARKPYDLLVVACLIAAWQIIDYRFRSDGFHDYQGEKNIDDLQPAVDFYNEIMQPEVPITEDMLWQQRSEFKYE
jgi:hypothetical protein